MPTSGIMMPLVGAPLPDMLTSKKTSDSSGLQPLINIQRPFALQARFQ